MLLSVTSLIIGVERPCSSFSSLDDRRVITGSPPLDIIFDTTVFEHHLPRSIVLAQVASFVKSTHIADALRALSSMCFARTLPYPPHRLPHESLQVLLHIPLRSEFLMPLPLRIAFCGRRD